MTQLLPLTSLPVLFVETWLNCDLHLCTETIVIVSILVAGGVVICVIAIGVAIYFQRKKAREVPYLPAKTEFEAEDDEMESFDVAQYNNEAYLERYPQITLQDSDSSVPSSPSANVDS